MFLDDVIRLMALLSPNEKMKLTMLVILMTVSGIFDVFGVASIMPFLAVLVQPDMIFSNQYLFIAYEFSGAENQRQFIIYCALLTLVVLVLNLVVKSVSVYGILKFTQMRIFTISRALLNLYLSRNFQWHTAQNSSTLASNVLIEVEKVVHTALTPLMLIIANFIVILFLIIFLIIIHPVLSLSIGLALFILFSSIFLLIRKSLSQSGKLRVSSNDRRSRIANDIFASIKDIKLRGLEAEFLARFSCAAKNYSKAMAYSTIAGNIPRFFIEAICFGGIIILALFLLQSSENLGDTIPILAAFGFAGYKLIPAFQQLYFNLTQFRFSGFALQNLSSEFESDAIHALHGNPLQPAFTFQQKIELNGITYFHPKKTSPILSELDLQINKGEIVGIVGKSGSGKSTLLNLLLCLLEPTHGEIHVDGKLLLAGDCAAFMRSIGYVPQSIYLYDDSIKTNIAFGVPKKEIDMEAVQRAARRANIHEFISTELPAGYDSHVGDRGANLSGGQIQRIGIARALYHDPDILILDEATSALDSMTEETITRTIKALTPKTTIIVVAHQTRAVKSCDNIFLLQDGHVTNQGKFETLMKNSPDFKNLYEG